MLKHLHHLSPPVLNLLNGFVTISSVAVCALAMMFRAPVMELTGIGPNWLLIWVVTWSVKRTPLQAILAGLALGWLQDGLAAAQPSHALPLALVGYLTARLQKPKFILEDFISVALIIFVMVIVAETVSALQLSLQGDRNWPDTWSYYRQVTLSSAILSSLWGPVIYYPLNRWWQKVQTIQIAPLVVKPPVS
jgi:rod shape-determining protein MreD